MATIEESFIGTCFMLPDEIGKVSVKPEEFADGRLGDVWKEMLAGSIDPVTIGAKFNGEYDDLLADCLNNVYTAAFQKHAKEISKGFAIRTLQCQLSMAHSALDNGEDPDAIINELMKSSIGDADSGYTKASTIVADVYQNLESKDNKKFVPTGFKDVDFLIGGIERKNLMVIAGRPSMGKELTLDSTVLLSCGRTKRMGDIKMNDSLASIDGKPSNVIGIYPQGKKPIFKITFRDGRTVEAGLEHQWEVMFRKWKKPRVVTTKWLIDNMNKPSYKNRLHIPQVSGDFGIDDHISIPPYLLGVLLGDGSFRSGIRLSSTQDFILNKISSMLNDVSLHHDSNGEYRLTTVKGKRNWLLEAIKEFGLYKKLSSEKFIPKEYLEATKSTRLNLINGLIDTDGTVEKTGSITYSTSSKQLALDFQLLARSLGCFCSMSSRIPSYTYKNKSLEGKRNYCLYISCNDKKKLVTLPCKKDRVRETREQRLNIISIDYVGEKEAQCISVDHDRCLYVTGDYIVTHNTAIAMGICLNAAVNYNVCFSSVEMDNESVGFRMMSTVSDMDLKLLRTGAVKSVDAWRKAADAVETLSQLNFYIDDNPKRSASQIAAQARRHNAQHGVDVLMIDYVGLLTPENARKNRTEQIAEMTRTFKQLAKELNCGVILLCQLNREADGQIPTLAHLRESGAVEQDADTILFPRRFIDDHGDEMAEVIVAKNRNGPTGSVPMLWHGTTASYRSKKELDFN